MTTDMARVRRLATDQLDDADVAAIRQLLIAAFADDGEGFTDEDWAHSVGGLHVVLDIGGSIAAHASIVERELHIGDRPVRTGYVEAVAVAPERQRSGLGSRVMIEVNDVIRTRHELGALGTGSPAFYERLGWIRWLGPTAVRVGGQTIRTPDDDGGILVLPTPRSPHFERTMLISCAWRAGDVW